MNQLNAKILGNILNGSLKMRETTWTKFRPEFFPNQQKNFPFKPPPLVINGGMKADGWLDLPGEWGALFPGSLFIVHQSALWHAHETHPSKSSFKTSAHIRIKRHKAIGDLIGICRGKKPTK